MYHECLEGTEPRESSVADWTGLDKAFVESGNSWQSGTGETSVLEGRLTTPGDGTVFTVDFTIENFGRMVFKVFDADDKEEQLNGFGPTAYVS